MSAAKRLCETEGCSRKKAPTSRFCEECTLQAILPKRGRGRPKIGERVEAVLPPELLALLDALNERHELDGRSGTMRAILWTIHGRPEARRAIERGLKAPRP